MQIDSFTSRPMRAHTTSTRADHQYVTKWHTPNERNGSDRLASALLIGEQPSESVSTVLMPKGKLLWSAISSSPAAGRATQGLGIEVIFSVAQIQEKASPTIWVLTRACRLQPTHLPLHAGAWVSRALESRLSCRCTAWHCHVRRRFVSPYLHFEPEIGVQSGMQLVVPRLAQAPRLPSSDDAALNELLAGAHVVTGGTGARTATARWLAQHGREVWPRPTRRQARIGWGWRVGPAATERCNAGPLRCGPVFDVQRLRSWPRPRLACQASGMRLA